MGREVRKVPADWQHPEHDEGGFRPLHGRDFQSEVVEWHEGNAKWKEGFVSDWKDGWKPKSADMLDCSWEEWSGECPEAADYMPSWPDEARTHFMMYETTTEGTPISPAFATPEELAKWLVDNKASAFAGETASYEAWLKVCQGRPAPSAIGTIGPAGMVLESGVEALARQP